MIVWPDMTLLIYSGFSVETTDSLGFEREELIGTDPLQYFYATPGLGDMSPFLSMIIATVVLLIQATVCYLLVVLCSKGRKLNDRLDGQICWRFVEDVEVAKNVHHYIT